MGDRWRRLKKGEELVFTQRGTVSTSFSKDVAMEFVEDEDDEQVLCCLLVLRLPKNTRGLYISTASAFVDLDEDELLLPHGSKFDALEENESSLTTLITV